MGAASPPSSPSAGCGGATCGACARATRGCRLCRTPSAPASHWGAARRLSAAAASRQPPTPTASGGLGVRGSPSPSPSVRAVDGRNERPDPARHPARSVCRRGRGAAARCGRSPGPRAGHAGYDAYADDGRWRCRRRRRRCRFGGRGCGRREGLLRRVPSDARWGGRGGGCGGGGSGCGRWNERRRRERRKRAAHGAQRRG